VGTAQPTARTRRLPAAGWLVGAGLLALLALLVLVPGVARAHATLLSSSPRGGQQMGTAPGVVVLQFSQPLDPRLSRVTVTDPTGTRVAGTVTGTETRVRLATNQPGTYRVGWTAVSSDDGHTSRGDFQFSVVVPATRSTEPAATQRPDSVTAALRAVQYAALLLVVGMLLLSRLARGGRELAWVRLRLRVPLAVALASGLLLVTREALAASGTPGAYLGSGLAGRARLGLVAAEAAALLSALVAPRLLPAVVAVALVALAASGHAATVRPAWWGITLDVGHLTGAGLWAGGILALATLRPPGGWRGPTARRLLDRFSPVALGAFSATVLLGGIQALQRLGRPGALLHTGYGQVLTLKLLAVAAMLPLSLLAWRRRPAPRAEAALVVGVVGLAALLAVSPLPPRPITAATSPAEDAGAALPKAGDLTLAQPAGQVLVGLTIRPGRPGRNQLLLHLLPLEGEQAAARLPAALQLGGRTITPQPCGLACRQATATVRGGETIRVAVGGQGGGTASFRLPRLPAPDGAALLTQAQRRMHALRTVSLTERLSWGSGATSARYQLEEPNHLRILTAGGAETVIIGATRYGRDAPGKPWQVQRGFPVTPAPTYVWDYFTPPVAPRIIGDQAVGGHPTRIVAFFGRSGQVPVWFRLWVDQAGLVRHAQMLAQGHFMDHDYHGFNAPTEILPPPR
jgi:copper transport protein